jgi:hypothetical protein
LLLNLAKNVALALTSDLFDVLLPHLAPNVEITLKQSVLNCTL